MGDKPQVSDLLGIIKVMIDLYINNKIDSLFILYNKFINTMSQCPIYEKIMPIQENVFNIDKSKVFWDYLY